MRSASNYSKSTSPGTPSIRILTQSLKTPIVIANTTSENIKVQAGSSTCH